MVDQRKFGRYEILGELGHGGMATVYHATDPSFGREVAIKVLPLQLQHHPQFRERFQREGRTIAGLEHPNIVPVYDVGEEEGVPFLVMRYMSGGTLTERIPEGGIALDKAAHIMTRLAAALDAAHEKNIVHRDLKPSNILFDQYGEAYVADFGIVKLAEETMQLTGSGVIGTPTYMSPEQASGSRVDGRSDVYSLAVVLYQMLTGRLPFEAETPMAIAVKHITEPIPDILAANADLPAGLHDMMHKALAKDPANRYQKAGELAADLNAALSGQPITAEKADHDHHHTLPMTLPSVPLATGTRPAASEPDRTIVENAASTATPARAGKNPALIAALAAVALIAALILIFRPFRSLIRAANNGGRDATPTTEAVMAATDQPTDAPTDAPPPTATLPPTQTPIPLLADRDVANAEALKVNVAMGAVTTTVIAAGEGVTSVQGEFADETGEVAVPTVRYNTQGGVVTVTIDQHIPDLYVADEDPLGSFEVRLPRHLPIDLRIGTGLGKAVIDLRGLNLRSVTLIEGHEATIFLPSEGDIAIRVEKNYGAISFEAPDEDVSLVIRSFEVIESFGLVRIELPVAGAYEVNVSTYNEVQFLVPASIDVFVSAPAELVMVDAQDPRFTESAGRTWSTGSAQGGENQVRIVVVSAFGTIKLLPLK